MTRLRRSLFSRRRRAAAAVLFVATAASASAAVAPQSDPEGFYAGCFAGAGAIAARIVDVDGFANWGHPGHSVGYDHAGFVGGALIGRRWDTGGLGFRVELDGTFGRLSATTSRLDPVGLDETALSEVRWVATVRGGVDRPLGGAVVFGSGGLAVARVAESVTDIDYGGGLPPRIDPDDSFIGRAADAGWVVVAGFDVPLGRAWALRLEGAYLDFGGRTYTVNRSGNNRCGPGNANRPCPYDVRARLGLFRWGLVHHFDW